METYRFERYCDDLNESVYPQCETPPPCRYRSRYARKVRVDKWCARSGCYKTMGAPRGVYYEKPQHFLKKHSRLPPVYFDPEVLRNPVGEVKNKQEEFPLRRQTSSERRIRLGIEPKVPQVPKSPRDFLEENALRVIQMPPKRMPPKCYLGEDGTSHMVDLSQGPYTLRPGYGEVPSYIHQRRAQLCEEAQELKKKLEAEQNPPNCRLMNDWERCCLINGLKCSWDNFQAEYLRLSVNTRDETKNRIEGHLKQLEADLRILNSCSPIYVSNSASTSSHFF